jgi:hypothetical protein
MSASHSGLPSAIRMSAVKAPPSIKASQRKVTHQKSTRADEQGAVPAPPLVARSGSEARRGRRPLRPGDWGVLPRRAGGVIT